MADKRTPSRSASNESRDAAEKPSNTKREKVGPCRGKDATRRLLQELQAHQIELEMRNAELRHARDELEATLNKFTDLYDFAPVGYFTLSPEGTIRAVNLSGASLLGVERTNLLGRFFREFVPDGVRPRFSEFLVRVFASQKKESFEATLNSQGRDLLFVRIEAGVCGSECHLAVSDISEQRRIAEALAKSEELFRSIVSNINEYVYSVSFENNTIVSTYHSPKCMDITGYSSEEYARDPFLWLTMVHEEDREVVTSFLEAIYAGKAPEPISHRIWHKNGSVRWLMNSCTVQKVGKEGSSAISRLDGFILDITDLKLAEESIFFLAHHDTLTGLPNRSTLYQRVGQMLTVAGRAGINVALLFLDLDGFKQVNDSLGHDVGDRVLQSVAKRLKDCTRYCDIVSRIGGDEFVVVLWDCRVEEATVVAKKIIASSFPVEGSSAAINASIGISLFPKDSADYLTLLKHADVAMYHAKKSGGKGYQFFTSELNEHARKRFAMEADLRQALERDEFVMYYQPKVNLATGKSSSMEALLRWQHPDKGFVLPGYFIGLAEETGLLTPISKWIILAVCRQLRQWRQQGIYQLSVAINLSASFFQQADFEQTLESALQETGVPPECLELELTEATLMNDPQQVLDNMAAMKALGVQLAIDDFGMGYSCLNYLKKLPVDKLKIDKSFIRDIAGDPDNMAVVRAIISIGRSMQLKVIAEGVENASQLAWLQAEGGEEAQGFYFSLPQSASGMTHLLKEGANYLHNPRGRLRVRESRPFLR